MFQVNELALATLLEASQRLHAELVKSPLWNAFKDEPIIVQWIAALTQVESEIAKNESQP